MPLPAGTMETGNGGSPLLPPAPGTPHPQARWERTGPKKHAHTVILFHPWDKCRKLCGSFPFSRADHRDSSSSPAPCPLCFLVSPTRCPRSTGCWAPSTLLCSTLSLTLAFSLHLQRLGQKQGRLGPSPPFTPHTHHRHPMRGKKK